MRKVITASLCLAFVFQLQAQISDKISKVNVSSVRPAEPATIQVDLVHSNQLDRIEIAYRQFGERDFKRSEMVLSGNTASITLPAEIIVPPLIEYYFILYVSGQFTPETFPVENPEQQPFKIDLQMPLTGKRDIIILSPERDERLRPDDLLISFSVSQFDSSVNISATNIYLDNTDLSKSAIVSGDLIVVKPEITGIPSGIHTVRVELVDTLGNSLDRYAWSFTVAGYAEKRTPARISPWMYGSSVQLETRQENISSVGTPYNRGSLSAFGAYNDIRIRTSAFVTNEEKSNRQPQNRFYIGAESPWLKFGYGDSYPLFPEMIMNGKRIRGWTANLSVGKLNVDMASGAVNRRVEGTLFETFPRDSLAVRQTRYPGASFDSSKELGLWARLQYGTFDRNLFVIRTILGRKDESHIGFSYLKATDDTSSIKYGKKPQQNVVLGSDMLLSFDHRNLEFTGQVGFSATNKDISGGPFSDKDIDSLFDESSRETVRKLRNVISKMITVNENLVPLGSKHMPTLSYEGGMSLNYFNNAFRISYLRHGKSFESFGQSFFQTDVQGYNLSDRQYLLQHQLFVSGGYEQLQDNTDRVKAATTTSRTANVGISYFPAINFPNVTVAYLLASNENGRPNNDTMNAIDDRTNRVMLQIGKEFKWGIRHNASFSVSSSSRNDNTARDINTRNTTVALNANSTFEIPLQTMVSLTVNSTKFPSSNHTSTSLTYVTLYTNAQYRLMEDRLRLSGSINPTLGDIQRFLVNTTVQYYFLDNVSAQTQLSLYFNSKMFGASSVSTDIVWNLVIRADI